MGYNNRNKPTFTNAVSQYNTDVGSIQVGYIDCQSAFIKVANVFEEKKGKKVRRGDNVYDHDNGIFFSFSAIELQLIEDQLQEIMSEERTEPLRFKHTSGESTKILKIGLNIFESDSENLQIVIKDFERDDTEGEPINEAYFEFQRHDDDDALTEAEINLFFSFITEAKKLVLKGGNQAAHIDLPFSGGGGGQSSSRRSSHDDDEEEEEEERTSRRSGSSKSSSRRPKGGFKGKKKEKDDVPF